MSKPFILIATVGFLLDQIFGNSEIKRPAFPTANGKLALFMPGLTSDIIAVSQFSRIFFLYFGDTTQNTQPKPKPKSLKIEIGFNVKGLEKNQFKNHEAYWVPWQSQFKFCLFPVSIGNPHVVCWVDDLYSPRVSEFADWIMMSKMFSSGVNLEICKLISTTEIQMRVFERGVGETSACGTGACAAAVSGICLEKLQSETDIIVNVCLGYMIVSWSGGSEDSVFLSGPAKTVFTGEIDIEQ